MVLVKPLFHLYAFNATRQQYEAELQAANCFKDAEKFNVQVFESFDNARSHSGMDMFGGGTLSDMMERYTLSRAENAIEKVRTLVQQAQRLSPDIQGLGDIDVSHGYIMSGIMSDNIFIDMA
ncbi:MAG: hypothetical protein Q9213_000722 [Squamulea squamosa]